MRRIYEAICLLLLLTFCGVQTAGASQDTPGIDPEALIARIVATDTLWRATVHDVVFDAEYIEGKKNDEGKFEETARLMKRITIKYLPDTAWYHEEILEFYKEAKIQSPEDREKEAAERAEKKVRRNAKDISYRMVSPFLPASRKDYTISYEGMETEKIDGYTCHHFRVSSNEVREDRFNGDYFFDIESFNLVHVDFSPAELVHRTMFKMKEMRMSIRYAPTPDSIWLPKRFEISGKGKAMFFIGVRFSGTEHYRNPVVNSGVNDDLFKSREEKK
jgi:hypothetical protein